MSSLIANLNPTWRGIEDYNNLKFQSEPPVKRPAKPERSIKDSFDILDKWVNFTELHKRFGRCRCGSKKNRSMFWRPFIQKTKRLPSIRQKNGSSSAAQNFNRARKSSQSL